VTQEHLRRKETDTDKAKPTTTLRQPQTNPAGNGALLATENSGDPDTQPSKEYGENPKIPEVADGPKRIKEGGQG
jgi:hypothetical protein